MQLLSIMGHGDRIVEIGTLENSCQGKRIIQLKVEIVWGGKTQNLAGFPNSTVPEASLTGMLVETCKGCIFPFQDSSPSNLSSRPITSIADEGAFGWVLVKH